MCGTEPLLKVTDLFEMASTFLFQLTCPEIDLASTFGYLAQTLVGPGRCVGVAGTCHGS